MSTTHGNLIAHELGHALVGLLSGLRVKRVYAPPPPDMTVPPEDPDIAAGFVDFEPGGDPRARALALLGGPLAEGKSASSWPIEARTDDERKLAKLVGEGDELTYLELVRDAEEIVADSSFTRMHRLASELIAHDPYQLDGKQLDHLREMARKDKQTDFAEGASMEHIEVKATAVATDLGQFTAIAAVFGTVDRDGDRIVKGAFADTIEAWQSTGRTVPLHWNHSAEPDDIVGHVVPGSMVETDLGLVVEGQLNLEDSDRPRKAWRAMKTGSIGLSFGYLVQKQRKAADGANELLRLDLFEVSLTPAPSNASTRVLGMKSADPVTQSREAVHRLMSDLVFRLPDEPCSKAGERQRKSAEPVKVATFRVDQG